MWKSCLTTCCLVVLGCQSPETNDSARADAIAAIRDANARWVAAFHARDAAAYSGFYTENGTQMSVDRTALGACNVT